MTKPDKFPHPCLKWPGGKRGLVKQIDGMGLFPESFNNYYEPFFGAGAIFFYLWKKEMIRGKSVISDINFELINVYKHIKNNPRDLIDYSNNLNLSPTEETFYKNRDRFNYIRKLNCNQEELLERAILMLYLNKNAYSGMYRENKNGDFNVPFGYYPNPTVIDVDNIMAISESFRNTEIECGNYIDILSRHHPETNDFIYFDPPYMKCKGVSEFNKYNKVCFDEEDQICLSRYYNHLSKNNVMCMLSNSSSEVLKKFYEESRNTIHTVDAPRVISRKIESNKTVKEFIITNYSR